MVTPQEKGPLEVDEEPALLVLAAAVSRFPPGCSPGPVLMLHQNESWVYDAGALL